MPRQKPTSGFVYIWRDRKHNRYYIGSHWGQENDGYVCSSYLMKNAYRKRPQDFKRRILQRGIADKFALHEAEDWWLKMIKPEELKVRYYNQNNDVLNHWMKYPDKSKAVVEKIFTPERNRKAAESLRKVKRTPAQKEHLRQINLGKSTAPEVKEKLSVALKKAYAEGRKTASVLLYGVSEKTKKKASESGKKVYAEGRRQPVRFLGELNPFYGKKHSDETRLKMSIAAKNRKRKVMEAA